MVKRARGRSFLNFRHQISCSCRRIKGMKQGWQWWLTLMKEERDRNVIYLRTRRIHQRQNEIRPSRSPFLQIYSTDRRALMDKAQLFNFPGNLGICMLGTEILNPYIYCTIRDACVCMNYRMPGRVTYTVAFGECELSFGSSLFLLSWTPLSNVLPKQKRSRLSARERIQTLTKRPCLDPSKQKRNWRIWHWFGDSDRSHCSFNSLIINYTFSLSSLGFSSLPLLFTQLSSSTSMEGYLSLSSLFPFLWLIWFFVFSCFPSVLRSFLF